GAVTVSETVVFTPPALTLISVEPAERPVATPTFCPSELTPLTDATLVAELNQVKTTPVIALSNWSYPTAANCCVFPAWMEAVDGNAAGESVGTHRGDARVGASPDEREAAHLISTLVVAHSGELLCRAGKDR